MVPELNSPVPEAFQVEVQGFSGPLDLLCHMVESREIEASQIKVSEVIALYGAYLARVGGLPIAALADFIVQAAHLVLQKTLALLPRPQPEPQDWEDPQLSEDEPNLEELLERYRPYRRAAALLEQLKASADQRYFRRGEAMAPVFDLGDLYSLSLQWLDLLGRRRPRWEDQDWEDWEIQGVPPAIPDAVQVENRMDRIMERLALFPQGLSLRDLLHHEPGRGPLVVTLLALLELSRQNKVRLSQREMFGDVLIGVPA